MEEFKEQADIITKEGKVVGKVFFNNEIEFFSTLYDVSGFIKIYLDDLDSQIEFYNNEIIKKESNIESTINDIEEAKRKLTALNKTKQDKLMYDKDENLTLNK